MSDETSTTNGGTRTSAKRGPYDPEELIGTTLAGRYEVEQCIGKGGMGVVYLASQSALGRKVVVKVLPRSFVDDEEALGRFEREAVGMSRLQHPHVVAIYDFGQFDGQAFICMEYIDGETLSRRIKRDGAIGVEDFAAVAAQILQGIGEAHSMGMIHRDIKPSNIMLTERHGRENYVKILDFGLAKLVKGAENVTKEQTLVGSTAFLSPEQIMGNDIDQRVDVYALGVLFYYMLTGEKPFDGDDDITVLYQHVHNPPPPLGEKLPEGHRVPAELIELVERMLAKQPDDRPMHAADILDELTGIMATTSMQIAWSTGDFDALSPPSSPIVDDASDRLDRGRQHTPMGQAAPPTSPSHAGLGNEPSSQTSFVTGDQMLQMQRESTRRALLIALVAILLVAGGLVAFFMWYNAGSTAQQPADDDIKTAAEAEQAPAGPTAESVRADIARANALVEEGKLGTAENILDLVEPDLKAHPDLKADYAAARDRLSIARSLNEAQLQEEQGNTAAAIAAYRDVLERAPKHQAAHAAIERLQAKQAEETAEEPAQKDEASTRPARQRPSRHKRAAKPQPKAAPKADKPADKPASKDGVNLLPMGEEPAKKQESDDDVQLLPIE